ncbi:peptide-methionine (R)-S-oxide reductase MsrB [Psychroflexus montanilacus]|uniref:peptide-methionine (R)-S-oxide reductase MsrB n=1 Tax=Psychroflexus montanilacus TaxID=2873598 RepID=UPI001CC9199D|nr:peptide-methionine (R)-S-oxide reductase MsrB [Psychroflexus montanilacus]MBZ9651289.1 peptide-methionine (R)-S-oxide reductase MsrB [Psychroflexus montanilacus]
MKQISLALVLIFLVSCKSEAQKDEKSKEYKVQKSESEWKAELSDEEYRILRKAGTESPYSSPLNDVKEPGVFVCAACGNELYETKHKFDSGTGWPSFDRAIENSLAFSSDRKLGYERSELLCGDCGGHLGHIFDDGPKETTGKRHCINGVALKFKPKEKS